ncbi:Centrosomal protein of 135 kDa [Gryllus bimaculatus]|nr:Centrosomal protein of 135 kDa [Gryllus bimaculatus]
MDSEASVSERRYRLLRKQLDELGYLNTLPIEALPLVERLISDLLHTTESLRHYKEIAQKSLEERVYFANGVEPYKQENAKLVRELNDLHIKYLKSKEEIEKQQKEFKSQIRKLQSENSDLQFLSSQHLLQVKELEKESTEKTLTILRLQNKSAQPVVINPGGKKAPLRTRPTLEIDAPLDPPKTWKDQFWTATAQVKDPYIANMVETCDERICLLSREVNVLKEERNQQSEKISLLETKILNRDRQIEHLTSMLEGGRPISAVGKDYCVKEMEIQFKMYKEEVKRLEKENKELEVNLKEAVASHHEASSKACRLAERNKQLETELRDIDHMALTVEAECNSTVKENNKKVHKIQEKLEMSLSQINSLEREILELKRSSQEQEAELGKIKLEKHKIQKQMDNTREEKKRLIEKINSFTVIEKDLMTEIDRLTQLHSMQKRRIAELETRMLNYANSSSSSTRSKKSPVEESLEIRLQQLQAERDHFKTEYHKLLEHVQNIPSHPHPMASGDGSNTIKRIQAERDHYQRDAEKLQEEIAKMTALLQEKRNDVAEEAENNLKLRRKLNEQDQEIVKLHQCIQDLNYEKQNLQKRIDGKIISAVARSAMTSPVMEGPGQSVRAVVNRCLRERDLAKGDVLRLEEERDALRARLKIATETQVTEHARLEKTIMESEDRVRRLELERRELMATTGVQKATINNLEDELETLREKFNGSQMELTQQRTLYTQIKSLQDQTDRALADSQGQLAQLEAELANSRDRVRVLESDRASLDREVSSLKTEQTVLRGNIAQVDQEKDALLMSIDSKTEQIAQLERQLKLIENKCVDLEGNVAELQRKLDISLEESAAREQALRAAAREAEVLRAELQTLERARDGLLRENRFM